MKPPEDLIERIKFWCESENLGMSAAISNDFGIIMFGKKDLNPDQVAVLCAHTALQGIVDGVWSGVNKRLAEEEKDRTVM